MAAVNKKLNRIMNSNKMWFLNCILGIFLIVGTSFAQTIESVPIEPSQQVQSTSPGDYSNYSTYSNYYDPYYVDNLNMYGKYYYNLGDTANAKYYFEQVLAYQPKNYDALYYLGNINYSNENYLSAVNYFKEVINLDPNNFDVAYYIAKSYVKLNKNKEALDAFDLAEKKFEANSDFQYESGLIAYKLGTLETSIGKLKKAITLNPAIDINAYFTLASAYFYKKLMPEATDMFMKVSILGSGGNWEKAAKEYLEAIEKSKPKLYDFSLFSNYESDSNVASSANPTSADADTKMTVFASTYWKPVIFESQPAKIGYSLYALQYADHPAQNFMGHMVEGSLNFPLADMLVLLKTNLNYYLVANAPYQLNIPIDAKLIFKILPWQGAWSTLSLGYSMDNHQNKSYSKKDAGTLSVGIKQSLNDNVSVGYEFKTSKAKGEQSTTASSYSWLGTSGSTTTITDDYSYSSHGLNGSYNQMLPFDVSFSLDGAVTAKQYAEEDSYTKSTIPTKRTDLNVSVSSQISRTLYSTVGFLAKVAYTAAQSNLKAAESAVGVGSYNSLTYSMGLTGAF